MESKASIDMKVEIWCDFNCPYSYMGVTQFFAATQASQLNENIEIEWRSFQLDPSISTDNNVTKVEYMAEKYDQSEAWAQLLCDSLTEQGQQLGINFNFSHHDMTNTKLAHLLMQYGKQMLSNPEQLVMKLFHAALVENKNLSDETTLRAIAEECQVKYDNFVLANENNALTELMMEDESIAKEVGISTVPFFIIDEEVGMEGMQPVEHIQQLIQDVASNTMCA